MKIVERIREALRERPEELSQARQEGAQVVGYFGTYIPEEIIDAMGLIPIRLGRGGDEALVELGARYISDKNCVFVRHSVGLFAEGKDPFVANSDIVAVPSACLQIFRLSEVVRYYCQRKTVALSVPRNYYLPEARVYFREEMKEFVRQMERLSGKSLVEERLRQSIKLYADIRRSLEEVYHYQALEYPPISWREVFEVTHAGFYLDRRQYLSYLHELLAEVRAKGREEPPDLRPRLLLFGSHIAPGDTKIIGLIEECGGRIVADDLSTGLRFHRALEVKEPSIPGIADAYLERIPCAALPCTQSLESDRRFANLMTLIQDFQVEGAIYHTLRFCDSHSFKANITKRFLQEKLQMPFLELHTEYSPSDIEAIRTRLESFMDILPGRG